MKIIKEGKKPTFHTIHAICPECGAEFEFSWNDCLFERITNKNNYSICHCPTHHCSKTFLVNKKYWKAKDDEICEPIMKDNEIIYEVKKKKNKYWRTKHVHNNE